MKKRILSIITIMAMIFSMVVPTFAGNGDNTGDDIFGMSMYINMDASTGAYTLGETFSFTATAYVGELYKQTAVRNISITGPAAVSNFQFKNDSNQWTSIEAFNITEIIYNEIDREFQVAFTTAGTYEIVFSYETTEGALCGSVSKYVTVTETSFSVSDEEPTVETTTPEPSSDEPTTEEQTTATVPENTVVAFNYSGFNAVAGDDLTEYAYESNDYTYKATTGTGTMMGSVNGQNLKHIEWGDAGDYGVAVPVMPASDSNNWTIDAYVSYTFSTIGYTDLSGSVEVGGTKKGPRDLAVGYYEGENFVTLETYTIEKNKTMYTIEFDLPESLENQESVTVYVKLTSTTNIGGNEMTSEEYSSGGELAFNNFVVTYGGEEPSSDEPTTGPTICPTDPDETTTPDSTTPSVVDPTTTAPTTAAPTTVAPTTKKVVTPPAKTSVKSASKKKAAKTVKVSIKKDKGAKGYRVQFSTTKKFKKVLVTKDVKKATVTISNKKLKNKKTLYVRVKAYKLNGKKKVLAKKWSIAKKVTIKK